LPRHAIIKEREQHAQAFGRRQMMRFVWVLALSLAMLPAAWLQQAWAQQGWPDKPIRVIVPLPAGSAVDVVGRLIMTKLGERLGQIMVVENRAGASGALASEVIAKAAPDGYTLGMATSTTHVTTAILNAKLPYDPVKDFAQSQGAAGAREGQAEDVELFLGRQRQPGVSRDRADEHDGGR
jgi:hypothetical protein